MATILARTVIIYLVLSVSMKIMGKRQIGEFEVSELVSTLLISELAAISICDPNIPILYSIIPLLFILSVEVLISYVKNKSSFLKRTVEGTPTYIIYKGRLLQKALADNRISVNEVLTEMRIQGISDICEVSYGVLEPNGKLSFIKKDVSGGIAHPLIIDCEVETDNLVSLGYCEEWLQKQLKSAKTDRNSVFLMTVNDDGEVNIIEKEKTH